MRGLKPQLIRTISAPQFFALSFGSVVGVAWIVIMGDAVVRAGPLGTALALGAGGLAVLMVALCYAEMAARLPAAGGELVYAHALGGALAAYATGWTMALIYTAACAFEALSIGQLFALLFPGFEGPILYRILGQDVRAGGMAAGAVCASALALLNGGGARRTALAQEWITYLRLALMLLFLAVAVAYGQSSNLRPLLRGVTPQQQWAGFLSVLATAPFWYAGFNVIATATEESGTSPKNAGKALIFSIVIAAAFYVSLVMAVSALVPQATLGRLDMPAAQAFEIAMGSPVIARLVLATALLGNLTAWNALLMAGSRVFFALGRAHLSPAGFSRLGRSGTPVVGVLAVTAATLAALMLGRGFVLPIVNLTSFCFAITYLVTCLTLLKLRRVGPAAAFTAPGGKPLVLAATLCSVGIAAVALLQPWIMATGGVPAEDWVLAGWIVLSGGLWVVSRKRIRSISDTRRAVLMTGVAS